MSKFNIGDKVRCVHNEPSYWYSVGDVLTIKSKPEYMGCEGDFVYRVEERDSYAYIGEEDFELVKEETNVKEFDLHKDKWFIRTPTPEIYEAVQLWLFEQRIGWHFTPTDHFNLEKYPVGQAIMKSPYQESRFCWTFKDSSSIKELEAEGKEIIFTYKTVIDTVTLPHAPLTQTQIELEKLQSQILALQEQASKLRNTIEGEK